MTANVHKCDVRIIALQALVSQDSCTPHDLHLFILNCWQLWMLVHTQGHNSYMVSHVFWWLICHGVICTLLCQLSAATDSSYTLSIAFLHYLHKDKSAFLSTNKIFFLKPALALHISSLQFSSRTRSFKSYLHDSGPATTWVSCANAPCKSFSFHALTFSS